MSQYERQKHLWELAVSILKENGITPTDEKMRLSAGGFFVVIHSKGLVNCLRFGPNMTDAGVRRYVKEQIEISKRLKSLLN